MSFYDIIPVESHGMSIITALVLFFILNGYWIYFWWDKREHSRIMNSVRERNDITEDKVNTLFEKIEDSNRNISEMNAHIASIQESLEWIKNIMQEKKE